MPGACVFPTTTGGSRVTAAAAAAAAAGDVGRGRWCKSSQERKSKADARLQVTRGLTGITLSAAGAEVWRQSWQFESAGAMWRDGGGVGSVWSAVQPCLGEALHALKSEIYTRGTVMKYQRRLCVKCITRTHGHFHENISLWSWTHLGGKMANAVITSLKLCFRLQFWRK